MYPQFFVTLSSELVDTIADGTAFRLYYTVAAECFKDHFMQSPIRTLTTITMTIASTQYQPLSKGKISLLSQLESKKFREKHGLFIVQGEKSVIDALGSFELDTLCATAGWLESHTEMVDKIPADKVALCNPAGMKKISSLKNPPEIVAAFKLPAKESAIPILDPGKIYLLLDGIQDPGNLGSILRTAHWFGVSGIFASTDTVDIYNPKAIMATMGSISSISIRYLDLASLIESNKNIPVYGTLLDGENIYDAKLTKGAMIVFGNEGKGISAAIRSLIDNAILIPPFLENDHSESLNVAAATAITLSEFRRRTH